MFMRRVLLALLAPAILGSCATATHTASPQERYGIGRIATAQEIHGWDIDVHPNGQGLPPGSGTVAAGQMVYESKCAACHGAKGVGGPAPRLTGGVGSLTSRTPVATVGSYWPYATTIYDYINRSMPWDKPLSLSSNEVYAVTAYLLHADGIIAANAVMDAKSLPQVKMPNRDGFVLAPAAPDVRAPRCMSNCTN